MLLRKEKLRNKQNILVLKIQRYERFFAVANAYTTLDFDMASSVVLLAPYSFRTQELEKTGRTYCFWLQVLVWPSKM